MNQPTFFDLIILIVSFPFVLANFLTTQILELIFSNLFGLGSSATTMIM